MGDRAAAQVVCDECGSGFSAVPYETRVKGGAWMRMRCPECGVTYDIAFVTTKGLKLRKQLQQARRRRDLDEVRRLEADYRAEVTVASASRA